MSDVSPIVRALVREALENDGRVSVSRLAQEFVPICELRELARRNALSPKGYRIEKAPAARLVPLLVDARRPDVVEELVAVLVESVPATRPSAGDPAPADPERVHELEARLGLREHDVERMTAELARCRSQATRQRERESELASRLEAAEERAAAARAEVSDARRNLEDHRAPSTDGDGEAHKRIHVLEREVDAFSVAEEELRRMVALRQTRIRELEEQNNELRELVPKGKRKKAEVLPAPRLADDFRLPYFTAAFYKSLDGKERRHVEKAIQAALLFCTEGPSYPGLEVKQIEGQELWSLRASLKLRVYFQLRGDGDVEFVAVADREDQHTTLRRLKER